MFYYRIHFNLILLFYKRLLFKHYPHKTGCTTIIIFKLSI